MSMDAAWKVYVGDRRFDDNQISNLFLKLKYETVGRFTFDFRPIDGDESYMQNGRTLRIFWGDLHKLDGVIQRVDWDSSQFCYHVYGADIRGFLLDRVNTEPSTVSSYTSDVQTQVMYTGCDFPSNIWTGAGDKIGTYTFHYKLGIQNTIRITGATQNIWHNIIERGTVYDHVNGCLYDATKAWEVNKYRGATLRFVSGACKNNVYNICGNSSNKVCLRAPTGICTEYEPVTLYEPASMKMVQGSTCRLRTSNAGFEQASRGWANINDYRGTDCVSGTYGYNRIDAVSDPMAIYTSDTALAGVNTVCPGYWEISFWYKLTGPFTHAELQVHTAPASSVDVWAIECPVTPDWTYMVATKYLDYTGALNTNSAVEFYSIAPTGSTLGLSLDDVALYVPTTSPYYGATALTGTVPGCSRLGDIYEIVTATMTRIEPASVAPATLEKDNHIISYNQVDDLSKHTTVQTVQGTAEPTPANTVHFTVLPVGASMTQARAEARLASCPRDIWSFTFGTAVENTNWQHGSTVFSDPTLGDLPFPLDDFTICIAAPEDFADMGEALGVTLVGTHRSGAWDVGDDSVLHELLHTANAIMLHTETDQLADGGFMAWLATAHPTYGVSEVTANAGTLCNEYGLYSVRNK